MMGLYYLPVSRYKEDWIAIDKKLSPALIAQKLKQECTKRYIHCTPCDIRNWTQMVQKSGRILMRGL